MHKLVDYYDKFEAVSKLESNEIDTKNLDTDLLHVQLIELESNENFIIDPNHSALEDL